MKITAIVLGLLVLLIWAISNIPNFSATVLNYSFNIPNILNKANTMVLIHISTFSITVSTAFLIVAVLLLAFGFLA